MFWVAVGRWFPACAGMTMGWVEMALERVGVTDFAPRRRAYAGVPGVSGGLAVWVGDLWRFDCDVFVRIVRL